MRTTNFLDLAVAETSHGASCAFAPSDQTPALSPEEYRAWLRASMADLSFRSDLAAYRRWAGMASVQPTQFSGPYAAAARGYLMSAEFKADLDQWDRLAVKDAARMAKQRAAEITAQEAMERHARWAPPELDFF